jgi:hypothetical protein
MFRTRYRHGTRNPGLAGICLLALLLTTLGVVPSTLAVNCLKNEGHPKCQQPGDGEAPIYRVDLFGGLNGTAWSRPDEIANGVGFQPNGANEVVFTLDNEFLKEKFDLAADTCFPEQRVVDGIPEDIIYSGPLQLYKRGDKGWNAGMVGTFWFSAKSRNDEPIGYELNLFGDDWTGDNNGAFPPQDLGDLIMTDVDAWQIQPVKKNVAAPCDSEGVVLAPAPFMTIFLSRVDSNPYYE